ncbi:MAG: thiol peroxidase [Halofilum sp. (in: g-proteobacteria)]|nr:thiol peroxidase [Halofilum sp. (in: g-proteobacteria)]
MTTVTVQGNPIRIGGTLPQPGEQAPDFRLIDRDLQERSLADFAGRRKVINVVPGLDTDVCAAQARRFNEEARRLENATVLVVSADLPFTQARFADTEGTGDITTLSTVRSPEFAEAYGVRVAEGPLAGTCARAVFVLDEHDVVVHAQLVPEIGEEPDYAAVLAALR